MGKKDIFVYLEQENDCLIDVGLEMLSPAKRLAKAYDGKVCAVLIGNGNMNAFAEQAYSCGADIVYIIEGEEYASYSCDAFTYALTQLVNKYEPTALMIGSTTNGRDFAPRVACRLKTGLTADVTGVEYDKEHGCISWLMPAFGGQAMASILCPRRTPQMGTIRPGVFEVEHFSTHAAELEVCCEDIRFSKDKIRTLLVETIKSAKGQTNLKDARIVITGGYGCQTREGFELVTELADVLGAAVGASRAAVDAGWIGEEHQIGQSGVTVQPDLYVACGVSGAAQHNAGMLNSKTIIAINSDPGAPIFDIATYGIVDDLRSFLPALIKEIKDLKAD